MTLVSGTRIGPYEVISAIGAGGMGEVYRARDSKLNRDVAIKILPHAFAADPERVARFRREAQVLASLNHPNIAHIYGLEESADGPIALVMELAEGPTLADRLAYGPISLDDALPIARQIADALECAHEQTIVHRDLKPANIKVRPDGTVKVLDFGLAKAIDPIVQADIANSPTITSPAMTQQGIILGSAAYMSPEQARGKVVDKRTDIWAFGCVLYEMLTGKAAFRGDDVTETLAAVVKEQPNLSNVPPDVQRLLRKCLQKDPKQRLRDIGDAWDLLERHDLAPARSASRYWLLGAAIVAGLAAAAAWTLKPSSVSVQPVRSFTIALPAGQHLSSLDKGSIALSSDGSQLAYVAATADNSVKQLYVRAMDTGATRPIAGTDDASMPFFSPDSQWLGFFAAGRMKKVPLNGAGVVTLTDVPEAYGATWTTQHTIVFASLWSVLERISDGGGNAPRAFTAFDGTENMHFAPQAVGSRVLFSSVGPGGLAIALGDLVDGRHRLVLPGRSGPTAYLQGHLVFLQQDGNLMTAPFDLDHGRAGGDPVLVVPDVRQFSVSSTGTLAYIAGRSLDQRSRLTWVGYDDGTAQVIDDRADNYYQPRLEPGHGDRIVMDRNYSQVLMYDIATHNFQPFTFNYRSQHAIWTRDGKELVFMTQNVRSWELVRQAADGSGKPVKITSDAGLLDIPYSLTPNGTLAFVKFSGTSESQLWTMPLHDPQASPAASEKIFSIPVADAEAGPAFSPDGQWLAYAASDASGRRQIYVQAFPGPGDKHQVSIEGGNEPLWNPDTTRSSSELFYRNGDDMMSVEITTHPSFHPNKPRRLFAGASRYQTVLPNGVRANYDFSPIRRRFLMLQPIGQNEAPLTEIHVVLNWSEDLKRLEPDNRQ
jgi:serine/threonine-protein kinase